MKPKHFGNGFCKIREFSQAGYKICALDPSAEYKIRALGPAAIAWRRWHLLAVFFKGCHQPSFRNATLSLEHIKIKANTQWGL